MTSREEFENNPSFKGMDFTRSAAHPGYYESPYANGAWDGWQASREGLVIELPAGGYFAGYDNEHMMESRDVREAIEAAGVKVKL